MKKSRKVFLICLTVASCLFLSSMNLYAADAWWPVTIDDVRVQTTPSTSYTIKVTLIGHTTTAKLNFNNKEMLAVALTAYSMGSDVLILFDLGTYELKQIQIK